MQLPTGIASDLGENAHSPRSVARDSLLAQFTELSSPPNPDRLDAFDIANSSIPTNFADEFDWDLSAPLFPTNIGYSSTMSTNKSRSQDCSSLDSTYTNTSQIQSYPILQSHSKHIPITPTRTMTSNTNSIMTLCTPFTPSTLSTYPTQAEPSFEDNFTGSAADEGHNDRYSALPTMHCQDPTMSAQFSSGSMQENAHAEVLPSKFGDPWHGNWSQSTGWTPYLTLSICNHIVGVKYDSSLRAYKQPRPILNAMRKGRHIQGLNDYTIFENFAQAKKFREEQKKSNPPLDTTLPRSDSEKRILVKMIFMAIKSCTEAEGNPGVQNPFLAQAHDNAQVEIACWELLEAAIERSTGEALVTGYHKASNAKIEEMSFIERVHQIILSLATEKSICDHILKPAYIRCFVDAPTFSRIRCQSNRGLNGNKKVNLAFGKEAKLIAEREAAAASGGTPPSGRKRRKTAATARVEVDIDEGDESEYNYVEDDSPIMSSAASTHARRFATPRRLRSGLIMSETPSPIIMTPTSSKASTYAGADSQYGKSPAESIYSRPPPKYINPRNPVNHVADAPNNTVQNSQYSGYFPAVQTENQSQFQNVGIQFECDLSFENSPFDMGTSAPPTSTQSSLPSNITPYSTAQPSNLRRQLDSPIQSPASSFRDDGMTSEPPASEYS